MTYNLKDHVGKDQRFRGNRRCPICNGTEDDPRGNRARCFGFLSGDGLWAHCTRAEHAGTAVQNPGSQAYQHRLRGPCPCGTEHAPADPKPTKRRGTIERTYDYRRVADGPVVFQAVRCKNPKGFFQRRPDGKGGWTNYLKGIEPFIYHRPELLAADPAEPVIVPEGEKDVDRLRSLGLIATCNPMGAGKWRDAYSEDLRARHVVIIPDNDQAGRDHAQKVARSVSGLAASVKVVKLPGLPEHGDASDWLDAGGTVEKLRELIAAAGAWTPPSRPQVVISHEEHETIDQAVAALAGDPSVFQRGFALATILRDAAPPKGIMRPPGSPRITPIPIPRLRTLITRNAEVRKWRPDRNSDLSLVPSHPPDWLPAAVAAEGEWPRVRYLEAVIEAPTLRHDGSLLDQPGYDPLTGLFYELGADFPPIPRHATQEDARASVAEILAVVCDFPFAEVDGDGGKAHRAAFLAACVTPLVRFAIAGPCPCSRSTPTRRGSARPS
jgi:hypothetical protein